MNEFKIVSFYTPNGVYPEMAERLKKSCSSLGVSFDIQKKNDLGSWVKNCAYKAQFIYERLLDTENNKCILWVDSDAVVKKYPYTILDTDKDFAIRTRPGARKIKPVGREYITLPSGWEGTPAWFESGTIFFRKTDQVMNMVKEWIELGNNNNKWDQWTLQEAWCKHKPATEWLPLSYCQINKMHGQDGAVILHDLASVIQKVNRL